MLEYTIGTVLTMLVVVALELFWLRTGIFRTVKYWLSIIVMVSFQIPMDGFLTRLSNPIVRYAPDEFLGIRWPFDIPIEDFGFGFAVITLTLMLWTSRSGSSRSARPGSREEEAAHDPHHSR
ncbi:lycopene cyclase domain-containing protein [Kocuria sp. TGY1127_2]|uniref:lycopene cyclase domain-containing protein n=1 Tax=Kocuria sp. TGY1127_2 TaxID=2711328 RepID=UPI0015B84EC1|nr:lycopene cyclase domain-containing protein [Kocuria sp. TGY1127_2]